ncbi:MAG: chitobiase/beta-hexosaminidase C-terminal domain-containing protein [Spirochaetes bacterium]|nr:chitobiase/beta-hexosaminidase C-terminal domain-containing protein [Spirochaetota bacterium]MBN2769436.1 chitobiase/beta-hexosaminidase C-terminal domain-containing protein [Spirochaetota bacterium]
MKKIIIMPLLMSTLLCVAASCEDILDDIACTESNTVKKPVFTPKAGEFSVDELEITLSCETEGSEIYYTTDGTHPDRHDKYEGPFTITSSTTIKAYAISGKMCDSGMVVKTYTLTADATE